ncbi:MAG: hypothetical protein IPK27_22150 [Rhodanobacteraceae bacterium]|nr:hypothetical protein [Rhodanobacteraceae bacterium]
MPMCAEHQPLLLELLEDRHQRGSVLLTSQLPLKPGTVSSRIPPGRRHPRPPGTQRRAG